MADAKTIQDSDDTPSLPFLSPVQDPDPAETSEWLDSLEYVLNSKGPERVEYLLSVLQVYEEKAKQ